MTPEGVTLDRAAIENALRHLGERLARQGVVADLYIFGGAAMALAYDARRATRDIDAVFQPHGVVREEAWAVADELGLPRWWLNEQASVYVAPGGDRQAPRGHQQRPRTRAPSPKWYRVLATELRCRPNRCTRMIKAVLTVYCRDQQPFAA